MTSNALSANRVVVSDPARYGNTGPTMATFTGRMVTSGNVSRAEKTLEKVLHGTADANVKFDDLRHLLTHLGFDERTRGSHHIFRRSGIEEMINLQREASHAKPYQVKQVRTVILKHHLAEH